MASDWAAMLDEITAKLNAISPPIDTPEARFADAVARYGKVAGHPDTIAALDKSWPEWRTQMGVTLVIAHSMFEPGKLYAGAMFSEPALTGRR